MKILYGQQINFRNALLSEKDSVLLDHFENFDFSFSYVQILYIIYVYLYYLYTIIVWNETKLC